ncbi:MAG: 5-methyltetrahydropteroyltriglutamate--homocysteine S-methyltransferase [bacterium]
MQQPPFRADHVGSFLRPKFLLDAREQFRNQEISSEQLREVEDRAIRDIVKFQEDLGLEGITDGEYRRTYFHTDFLTQLGGVVTEGGINVSFKTADGSINFAPPVMKVEGKVSHLRSIQGADFDFLKSITNKTPKVTIPSPTMLHFRGGRKAISEEAYPEMEDFYSDVAKAYQEELRSLAERGASYVQLDDTNLAYLCDPKMREGARQRGEDPDALPRRYAQLINAAIADRPAGLRICVHLCRGNFKSAWVAEGGYEPVAEVLFNELDVDGYFLEYDDERSGDFAPLRHVPKNKTVVLGLVTTKLQEMETKDELKQRIEEAARYMPLEQMALSPQCGFSSTVHCNDIAFDAQAAKLRLVTEVAQEEWGSLCKISPKVNQGISR